MNSSDILSSIIDAEIALCRKGYPDARASIICQRGKYTPDRPWVAEFYLFHGAIEPHYIQAYSAAQAAAYGIALAVEGVEARPRAWTAEETAATLGIVEYAEAAE